MSGAPDIRRLIADRWSELSPLFDELLDVDPAQRERWLDRHCADPALRAGLEQLIADSEREGLIDIGCERLARCLIPAGSDPDPAPPTWIGRRLGAYRIERLVGEGGMASVFLATRDDGGFEQRVAIKLLRQGMLDPYEQQRFLRERQILAGLEHPLIARLIDGGLTPEGVPWFAMEYVDGETLTDHCDRRGLEIDARLGLFLKVCEAVSHAHHALVVHRDLKPSNILVDGDGSLKLLDFGIARLIASELDAGSPDAMATTLAQRRLTPAYAAPEQWRDGAVTTATDVYALGVLLHELLTGLRPARRDDDTLRLPSSCLAVDERREELARQRGSLAGPLRRRLAGDLDMILCCALRLEPARRYASVDEFAADIRRHLSQRPVRARPERLGYRAGRFLRRHRVGAIAVLLVLLSVAAGVTGTLRQAGEARRAAERAQIEAQRAESVKNFLLGLFEAAAPDRSLGRELTVRELLDRGALTLSARMAETPALRAELQLILAGIYRELGQFDEAADLVEQARPAVRDQAAMSLELGRIAYAQTRYEAAEVALRAALADLDERDDPDRRALILTQLAEVLAVRDRREEAEAMVREAIELHRDGPTADALTLARDQTVLGTIAFGRGDLDAAERAIREALALRISALGPTHTQVATSQHDLAVVVLQRGDVDTAESMFELALTTRRQLLGADHPETAATLRNLGAVKRRQNDLATAERYYTEAADSLRRRFPDGHSELAHALNSLAVLEQERGRLEKAIAYLEEAVIGARNVYGPEHQTVGTMLNNVAALHRVTGGLDRAAQAQQEALTVLGNAVGERHHLYAVALSGQGFIELESGQVQAAYERFDAAAAVFSATLGEAHPDYAAALTGRSEAALGIGDQAAALADARTAFEVNAAALPPQHPRLRRSRLILAEALAAAGDCAAAGTEIERIGEPYTDVERPRVAALQQVCR